MSARQNSPAIRNRTSSYVFERSMTMEKLDDRTISASRAPNPISASSMGRSPRFPPKTTTGRRLGVPSFRARSPR